MEELQLEVGVKNSFFSYSYAVYGSMATRSWMAATWQFLSKSNITLLDPFPKPKMASTTDCFLMKRFAEYGYIGAELRHLNSFRMHLYALPILLQPTGNS